MQLTEAKRDCKTHSSDLERKIREIRNDEQRHASEYSVTIEVGSMRDDGNTRNDICELLADTGWVAESFGRWEPHGFRTIGAQT